VQLFAYQRVGVAFIESRRGRALLADDMGLGKTIQALGWLRHRKSVRPVIIVCPQTVRLNWRSEIDKWLGETTFLPSGTKPGKTDLSGISFIIIHYDILHAWVETLKALRPGALVIDEAQFIKSNGAKRTKAVKALARSIRHVIGLTGTPIVNRPIELFNILRLIDKTVIPDWWHYTERYCARKSGMFGWDCSGASHTKELHDKLTSSIMLRRTKEEVLTDLPAKMRSFVPLELTNRSDYNAAERDFIGYLRREEGLDVANRAKRAPMLTRISKLRDLAAQGKLSQAIEWIADVIEVNKLVVFAVHRNVFDPVYERFEKVAVKVAGDVAPIDRQKAINRFQQDPNCRLFVGQIQAAGTGITLTAASHVAFLELPWTPGDLLQAEDRCHRIGQTKTVNIYFLLASGTIDEPMARLIDRKRVVLNAVLDGAVDAAPSILTELLSGYKQRGVTQCRQRMKESR
jgi:SWI/SNF-related matrix-associated actin-dependent regulator 1 of chromatin subfamily A